MIKIENTLQTLISAAFTVLLAGCLSPSVAEPPSVAAAIEAAADAEGVTAVSEIQMVTLVENLDDPWGMDFLPSGDLLVSEKSGQLKFIDGRSFAVSDIQGLPASAAVGQGGLLDVLVHPRFSDNNWVYLSYTVARDEKYTTRVSRARLIDGQLTEHQVLFSAAPYFKERHHFGSRLLISEGYLYITVGDRGNRALAQSLETHNGKVIRLTEDGAVPADNPFVGSATALPEIWSYGHRNPQGIAQHPYNSSIWLAEHGPQGGDELNILKRGGNYGWPLVTYGEEYGGGKIGQGTHKNGTEQPLVYWLPSIGTSNLTFYTGDIYPGWQDSVLVGGLKLTRISRLVLEGEGVGEETRLLANLNMRIRDLQVGPDGRLYALADGSRLIRLQLEQ